MVSTVPPKAWKTITIPEHAYEQIRQLAQQRDMAIWQLVVEMASFYQKSLKKGGRLENADMLDKVAYYIIKLMYSVDVFKINPSQENLEWLEKTIRQLDERLGIKCYEILQPAKRYLQTGNRRDKGTLNMCAKECVMKLIALLFQEHGGT